MKRANFINAQAHFDKNKDKYNELVTKGNITAFTFIYPMSPSEFYEAMMRGGEKKLARMLYTVEGQVVVYIETYADFKTEEERHEVCISHKEQPFHANNMQDAVSIAFTAMEQLEEAD